MAEKHIVICDRCDEQADLIGEQLFPSGWSFTDIGALCPECYQIYKDFIKTFKDFKQG